MPISQQTVDTAERLAAEFKLIHEAPDRHEEAYRWLAAHQRFQLSYPSLLTFTRFCDSSSIRSRVAVIFRISLCRLSFIICIIRLGLFGMSFATFGTVSYLLPA